MAAVNQKELKLIISAYTKGMEEGLKRAKSSVDRLGASNDRLKTTLESVSQAGNMLIGALGPLAGALAVREVIQASVEWDSYEKALISVTGSQQAANEELGFLHQVSEQLGLDLQSATSGYINLAAAAKGTVIEGEGTREIFEAVAGAMAKLGKSTADTDAALLAIGQMMSKGKVSAEELRGQLGERMPGAFKAFAEAAGVSTSELDAMLQRGEVGIDLLPKFAEQLRTTFDLDAGKIETAQASLNRLNNSLLELKLAVANSGLLKAFTSAIDDLSQAIQDPGLLKGFQLLGETVSGIGGEGQEFRLFVNSMVEGLKLLMLGAQTALVPIKLLGESAGAAFAAISFAIEGDFKSAMAVLQDSTPGDKFRADMEKLEEAAANIGSSFNDMGEKAATSARGMATAEEGITSTTSATEALAEAQTNLTTATDSAKEKHDLLATALGLAKPTVEDLKAAVDSAADAYYAAASAADTLATSEQTGGQGLKDLETRRKSYTDAVKALNTELWQSAIYGFEQEEQALDNSLKDRRLALQEQLQNGLIDKQDYNYQILSAEEETARQILAIRQETLETSKEIYGEDSEEYAAARQDVIEAEFDVRAALLETSEALDNLGTSADNSSKAGIQALEELEQKAIITAETIAAATQKAFNEMASGFYATWDAITSEISALTSVEDVAAWQQENRDQLNASGQLGGAFSNALNQHASDLSRRRYVELQESAREWVTLPTGQRVQNSAATINYVTNAYSDKITTSNNTQTITLKAADGRSVSGEFQAGDFAALLDILRQAGMVTT